MFSFAMFFLMTVVLSETPAAESSIPLWFWIVMGLILIALPILVLIFGPGLRRKQIEQTAASQETGGGGAVEHDDHHHEEHHAVEHHAAPAALAKAPPEPAEPAPVRSDDLKKIEGIGPKIAAVLENAGIHTFAQLAETNVPTLQEILGEESRLRLADPTTWPAQAKLAAAGDWEALQQLQDGLVGGRK